MKIGIITAGILPVPAIRGGAVETLITQFIEENEKKSLLEITVFTVEYPMMDKINHYNNTNFEYIKVNKIVDKFFKLYSRIVRKFFNINVEKDTFFIKKINRILKNYNFDKIIIENNAQFVDLLKTGDTDIYLHIHNDYLNKGIENHKQISEKCKKIIVVSEYIEKQVNTISHIEEKIKVLKNCVNINQFNKDKFLYLRKTQRERLGIKENDIVLMFTGRVTETKGVKELLEAFNMLKEKDNIKLLIVGSTWYSQNDKDEYLNNLISISRSFEKNIIFTGYISHNELPKIHVASDIAVIPSIWEEPAGLVVLEAMASELPIITTNSGGIVEYTAEKGAIIVERNEKLVENLSYAIELLCKDKVLQQKMGKENRKHVIQFDVNHYYNDFIKLLKE